MKKQKLIKGPIKGYKGTDKNMMCRGFQFKMGENVLDNEEDLVLCENGFHFCQHPSGPFAYLDHAKIWQIEAYDVLPSNFKPGANYKQVCRKIVFIKEIEIKGYWNTGNQNIGNRNTGNQNVGDQNTGYWNTGDYNTGSQNVGDRNTGYYNTGSANAGHGNTGHRNTGYGNIGNGNTGKGNATNYSSGFFCIKEPPVIMFDLPTKIKRADIDWDLVDDLVVQLRSDEIFDAKPYLSLPNATIKRIEKLHKTHIKRRQTNIIAKGRTA